MTAIDWITRQIMGTASRLPAKRSDRRGVKLSADVQRLVDVLAKDPGGITVKDASFRLSVTRRRAYDIVSRATTAGLVVEVGQIAMSKLGGRSRLIALATTACEGSRNE